MRDSTGVTAPLRWLWVSGAVLLAVGLLVLRLEPQGALFAVEIAIVLIAAAGGTTAARGASGGRTWNALAWSIPSLPILAGLAVYAWFAHVAADPMMGVALVVATTAVAVAVWSVFVLALVVEVLRSRRRRRFGEARPAWEDGPSQPT